MILKIHPHLKALTKLIKALIPQTAQRKKINIKFRIKLRLLNFSTKN